MYVSAQENNNQQFKRSEPLQITRKSSNPRGPSDLAVQTGEAMVSSAPVAFPGMFVPFDQFEAASPPADGSLLMGMPNTPGGGNGGSGGSSAGGGRPFSASSVGSAMSFNESFRSFSDYNCRRASYVDMPTRSRRGSADNLGSCTGDLLMMDSVGTSSACLDSSPSDSRSSTPAALRSSPVRQGHPYFIPSSRRRRGSTKNCEDEEVSTTKPTKWEMSARRGRRNAVPYLFDGSRDDNETSLPLSKSYDDVTLHMQSMNFLSG